VRYIAMHLKKQKVSTLWIHDIDSPNSYKDLPLAGNTDNHARLFYLQHKRLYMG